MDAISNLIATENKTDYFYQTSTKSSHQILTVCSCVLSIMGCLIIFVTFFLWKDLRTPSRRILMYITLSDFVTVLSYLVALTTPNYKDDVSSKENRNETCTIIGILSTFSMIASFLWTLSLAVYLYIAIVAKKMVFADKLLLLFHIICWFIPFAVTLSAALSGVIGYDGDYVTSGWCWIKVSNTTLKNQKPDIDTVLWMLLAGKGWEMFSFVGITVLYILIRIHMWHQVQDKQVAMPRDARNLIQRANRKMTWIPVMFLILRIWGTLRFILFATGLDSTLLETKSTQIFSNIILYLQGLGDCGQGWANCILFCLFTNKVYEHLKHCFFRHTYTKKHSSRKNNKSMNDSMAGVVSPSHGSRCFSSQPNEQSPLITNHNGE